MSAMLICLRCLSRAVSASGALVVIGGKGVFITSMLSVGTLADRCERAAAAAICMYSEGDVTLGQGTVRRARVAMRVLPRAAGAEDVPEEVVKLARIPQLRHFG